jgi:drug/metabolite transporter (DMT)-like permease
MFSRTTQPQKPLSLQRLFRLSRVTVIAFIALVVLNAGASLAIRFTYAELPTFWGAAARFALAALVMWLLVLTRKIPLPRGRNLFGAVLFGVLSMGASLGFVYWGLVKTPASLYQIITAIVPLVTVLLTALHGVEKFRWRSLFGALLAVVGIAVILGGSARGTASIPHLLAIVAGATCTAYAGVIIKRFPGIHPVGLSAVAMTIGALMLAVMSLLQHERWVLPSSTATWLAFAYIVFVVTVGGFLLYLFVLGRWKASSVSYGFVLVPIITIGLATWLAGEHITPAFILGGAVVLGGAWVGALMPASPTLAPTHD